jgi:hypothetical protein
VTAAIEPSSFPRKPESGAAGWILWLWMPAFAGMTKWGLLETGGASAVTALFLGLWENTA